MWLLRTIFGTFVVAQFYHPWVVPALRNYPQPLFWPEHDQIAEPSEWMRPPSVHHYNPLWPAAEGPTDYEPGVPNGVPFMPNEEPPNRFDHTSPEPNPISQFTPERFGFVIPTTNAKPVLKASSTPAERQSSNNGASSPRPTRINPLQTASSVPISEASSTTTTEAWTFPPTTQDAVQSKIQLSVCINNCVTDKSVKSVCGSDNKTYQNRQFLDCAQQCGQNVRLDYTGRCIPNPPSG